MSDSRRGTLIIACGALAREIAALRRANDWSAIDVRCLPAELHNRPERIAPAVQAEIRAQRAHYAQIFVAYADCGTGGALDAVLKAEGVERLPGAHCYEFFATPAVFAALAEAEPGTFYLTDFLLKNFERFVIRGLGIDRHPELKDEYFRNYRRLVYLAQAARAGKHRAGARDRDSAWASPSSTASPATGISARACAPSAAPQDAPAWPA